MNKICRICLEEGVLTSIFTKNFNISLSDMIEFCCNVKISKDDGLPEQLCSNCAYKLGVAYHFKQTCESSNARLSKYLGIEVSKKFNDAAIMTDPVILPTPQTNATEIRRKCKCQLKEKNHSSYKRKPESEKKKRGPKPKPKESFECHQCEKEFRCLSQLEMHIRTHTGVKPFRCMYCSQSFAQKHNLTIHVRTHTGEKPFQCEVCSKTFTAQGNLNAHLKIHTGQKDHVCSVCNKSFITSSELNRHMVKHSSARNFRCHLCDCAYAHARDLNLHKMKKHQIPPQECKQNNDSYNNSGNVDIIGLDVAKDAALPKDNHHIHHLINDKTSNPLEVMPENQGCQKDVKNIYQPYQDKSDNAKTVDYSESLKGHFLEKLITFIKD